MQMLKMFHFRENNSRLRGHEITILGGGLEVGVQGVGKFWISKNLLPVTLKKLAVNKTWVNLIMCSCLQVYVQYVQTKPKWLFKKELHVCIQTCLNSLRAPFWAGSRSKRQCPKWTDPHTSDPHSPPVSQTDQSMGSTGPGEFTLPICPASILSTQASFLTLVLAWLISDLLLGAIIPGQQGKEKRKKRPKDGELCPVSHPLLKTLLWTPFQQLTDCHA